MSSTQEIYKIVVVDDSRLSRRVVLEDLKTYDGVETFDFDNALTALKEIEGINPDMVISDFEMPDMDGLEFCAAVRSNEKYAKIPFLIISANVNIEFNANALKVGVDQTLLKGFKNHELGRMVEPYVQKKLGGFSSSVLIVDDSKFNRNILKNMLEELDSRVYEAPEVESAEKILEEHSVDLILLDHEMPGMLGMDWCKLLREEERCEDTGIVCVSGTKENALNFLEVGADDFIQKPFTREEIHVKVKLHLGRISMKKELHSRIENEKALSHQKNVLLGTAAHDIRNPISAIISYLSLVKENTYDDEFTGMAIETSYDQAEKALELLNEILDVSNISSGVLKLDIKENSLAKLLEEKTKEMTPLASKKKISLNLKNLCSDPTETWANFDQKRLGQVMENLLSNALKYSHSDTQVTITLDRKPDGWCIEVIDQGQGIPSDEVEGVFNEFKKTSVKTTGGESSTGLGLAIVRKIVNAHGGVIWIESEEGKGSTFSFTLPF
jgi:two-component system, sensor histidine kinase and response regulator